MGADSRETVSKLVAQAYPELAQGAIPNYTGQMWALKDRISVGDLVVMPLRTVKGQIAVGTVTGPYQYLDEGDADRRHVRPVQWDRPDVPRTAIKQDLLYTLGAFLTVCEVSRNDGAWRIRRVFETGHDPGARASSPAAVTVHSEDGVPQAGDVSSDSTLIDIERHSRDRISSFLIERFAGHRLESLVAAVLTAEGFTCTVTKASGDGGVDVFAGKGALGLDAPRLVVQVKSDASPVGSDVVQKLQGALGSHAADQALLVAWGGVSGPARALLVNQHFRLRVWDSEDLIDALCRNYQRLPEEVRAELPLKQVWTVVEEDSP